MDMDLASDPAPSSPLPAPPRAVASSAALPPAQSYSLAQQAPGSVTTSATTSPPPRQLLPPPQQAPPMATVYPPPPRHHHHHLDFDPTLAFPDFPPPRSAATTPQDMGEALRAEDALFGSATPAWTGPSEPDAVSSASSSPSAGAPPTPLSALLPMGGGGDGAHKPERKPPAPGPKRSVHDSSAFMPVNLVPKLEGVPHAVLYSGYAGLRHGTSDWLTAQHVSDILQFASQCEVRCGQPNRPPSGSIFYFDVRTNVPYRRDGYDWIKKKGSSGSVREDHVKLQLGKQPKVYASYVHSNEYLDAESGVPRFHRRSYWLLGSDPTARGVLVHYLLEKDCSGPTSVHAPDCQCLTCVVTRRNQELGDPFQAFWAEEKAREEARRREVKEDSERKKEASKRRGPGAAAASAGAAAGGGAAGADRPKKDPKPKRPAGELSLQEQQQQELHHQQQLQARRKRDSAGSIKPLELAQDAALSEDPISDPPPTPEWPGFLSRNGLFDEDMEHELLFGHDSADFFSLDAATPKAHVAGTSSLLAVAPERPREGEHVLVCIGNAQTRQFHGDWDAALVQVSFEGGLVASGLEKVMPGVLRFLAPAGGGAFRVRLGELWMDPHLPRAGANRMDVQAEDEQDENRPVKRNRPSSSPAAYVVRATASPVRDLDQQGEDEMGEDELDGHATLLVESAVRMMTSGGVSGDVLKDVIDEVAENGFNFLHTVIFCGARQQIVEMLLAKGADPNRATAAGDSPLHLAAGNGDLAVVQSLVAAGADLAAEDARGHSPLQAAIDYGHVYPELFRALGDRTGLTPSPTPLASPARVAAASPRIQPSPGAGLDRTREEHLVLLREALAGLSLKEQYTLTMAVADRGRSNSVSFSQHRAGLLGPALTAAAPHPRSLSMTDMSLLAAEQGAEYDFASPQPDDVSEVVEENHTHVLAAMAHLDEPERSKLNHEASVIQSNVRAWILRRQFLEVREATRKVQAVAKGHLARRHFRELRERASATLVIQKSLRAHILEKKRREAEACMAAAAGPASARSEMSDF